MTQTEKPTPRLGGVLLALALAGAAAGLAHALALELERRGFEDELVAAADALQGALLAYNQDQAAFPPSSEPTEEAFQRETLEPLVRRGFLHDASRVTEHLDRGRVTAYDSPDLPTVNGDFWAVLVHANDRTVQCLVADTDEYPGHLGERLRGTYLIQGTRLKQVSR